MINPITLLNASIKTPNIFNRHKNEEKENQDDGVEVVVKKTPVDNNGVSVK